MFGYYHALIYILKYLNPEVLINEFVNSVNRDYCLITEFLNSVNLDYYLIITECCVP